MNHRNLKAFIVGYGSQAQAWAACLRDSGYSVEIFLSRFDGTSAQQARAHFFPVFSNTALGQQVSTEAQPLIAMLCPDSAIAPVYEECIAALNVPLTLVLAHGFSVYSQQLKTQSHHSVALLAPKAIGPKLREAYTRAAPLPHSLKAAWMPPAGSDPSLQQFARALGFDPGHLIPATFENETIGDLISEQGLLCGGIFTLMEWTIESMREANIPEALIREECITELELIAGLIQSKGIDQAFLAISAAAKAGTLEMRARFESSGLKPEFESQMNSIIDGSFGRRFLNAQHTGELEQKTLRFQEKLKSLQEGFTS